MSKPSWDILQCPLAKRCRARWERLEPVQGDPAIRFCATCERSVHLCRTDAELNQHSALGRCVALEIPIIGVAYMGEPLPDWERHGAPESASDDALAADADGSKTATWPRGCREGDRLE